MPGGLAPFGVKGVEVHWTPTRVFTFGKGKSDVNKGMKSLGISHGACDYLLKPIRIEELKNIWQHVIRRKKFDPKDQKVFDKPRVESGDLKEFQEMCGPDENGKINRKTKDQIDDEDEERDENGHNNEDPSAQKKARVVWSVELHQKFVAAVNMLGIDSPNHSSL